MKYGKEGRQEKASFTRGTLNFILLGTLEVSVNHHLKIIPNKDEGDGYLHVSMH